jgi:hypothetical protein
MGQTPQAGRQAAAPWLWAEFSTRLGFSFFLIVKFHLIQFEYQLNFQNLNKFVENSEKYKVNFV